MTFGLSTIFSNTNSNAESFPHDSQILLFPNDIPAKLNEYELITLSITNGHPDKYLINYKEKILLKLLTVKYRDRPTSVFVNNYTIQIKHLIVAYKYDFIHIILKIIFALGEPFSFVSSKIKSYFIEQKHPENLKIESKIMKLWENNFSQVQSRIKSFTNEYTLNDRILLKPNTTVLFNCLLSLKNRIMQFLKCNKYHFTNYSSLNDSSIVESQNKIENKKTVNQCTMPIKVIHNKILSTDSAKLELFSWTIAISLLNKLNLDNVIPEDLLATIKKFISERPKDTQSSTDSNSRTNSISRTNNSRTNNSRTNNSSINKRQTTSITSTNKRTKTGLNAQTSIVNYFKPL